MKKIITIAASAVILVGCASNAPENDQTILFTSEPSGASVLFSEVYQCDTPCSMTVNRMENPTATFALGNELRHVQLVGNTKDNRNQKSFENVLLFGLFGVLGLLLSSPKDDVMANDVHVTF